MDLKFFHGIIFEVDGAYFDSGIENEKFGNIVQD